MAGKAERRALKQERTESERFGKTIINSSFAVAHFRSLFEQFDDFRMDVKSVRNTHQRVRNFREFVSRNPGFHFVFRTKLSAMKCGPVRRQLAKVRILLQLAGFALFDFVFCADSCNRFRRVDADALCVELPQRRMIFDAFVEARLSDGWIVDFAVTVAAIAN